VGKVVAQIVKLVTDHHLVRRAVCFVQSVGLAQGVNLAADALQEK